MTGKRWQGKQKNSRWRSSDDNVPVEGQAELPPPQAAVDIVVPLQPTGSTPIIWPLPEIIIPAIHYGLPPMENAVGHRNFSIEPRSSTLNSNVPLLIVQS